MGRVLEEEVAKRKVEESAANLKQGDVVPRRDNLPHREKGTTRDIVGKAVGMGGSTYQHAKQVVVAAENDPDQFGHLVEKMDRTGQVASAYRQIKQPAKTTTPKDPPGPRPNQVSHAPAGTIVKNITHGFHAAVIALNKVSLNGASNEEVAGWIGDLEDPLRLIRKIIRTWKEHA